MDLKANSTKFLFSQTPKKCPLNFSIYSYMNKFLLVIFFSNTQKNKGLLPRGVLQHTISNKEKTGIDSPFVYNANCLCTIEPVPIVKDDFRTSKES
jgi:hypothetical protein